jgi:Tfp pilus assembly protein PilX
MKSKTKSPWPIAHDRERGMVLILTVILMSVLLFVTGTTAIRSIGQTRVTARDVDETKTFYAAEAGAEWGAGELRNLLLYNMSPTQQNLNSLPVPNLPGFQFTAYSITPHGAMTQQLIQSGDYAGLTGFIQQYLITSEATGNRRSSRVERIIEHQFIPPFQFGVFYDKDLEIIPGPQMNFIGRIHTNGDLYIAAESRITCDSYVTAVGQIWHFRKDGGHTDPPGIVDIRDQFGVYKDMWTGSYWLDERQADWMNESINRWGGMVLDSAHGIHDLKLPMPPASDMYQIIERGKINDTPELVDARYWYKACTRIVDGVMKDSSGHTLTPPAGVISYMPNKFYDQREGRWMDVLELDVGAMVGAGLTPCNGILYISGSGVDDVVRIKNGSQLPTGGLTIVTDNPLYVKGSYNSVTKKPAALICDAITMLSSSWDDSKSSGSLQYRNASSMTVNACIMTGHKQTSSGGNYSGGLENLFRFLERWDAVTLTFRGSIVDLWFSRKATGSWSYGVYYTAPIRNWGFDTDLLDPANWPPGTPRVHTIQRGSWRQIS